MENHRDLQTELRSRPSLVDVFENFLGQDIKSIDNYSFEKLEDDQAKDLVEEVDRFLDAAAQGSFAEDAITLDGFASPIILPHDKSEPRTTRRAKQVSLMHSEVVFPVHEFSMDYARFGRAHLASLCQWTRQNEKLLRSHVFSLTRVPDLFDLFEIQDAIDLADHLMSLMTHADQREILEEIWSNGRSVSPEDLKGSLSPIIYSTLQDAAAAATFGTGVSFTQQRGGRLYQFCASVLQEITPPENALFKNSALLFDLELPSIDDLPDDDFVGIRLYSEDFGEFREVLERALRRTAKDIEGGQSLERSFHDSLDEVRWRAELLRNETRDKHLASFLRSTLQNVAIGSVASTAASATAAPPQSTAELQTLAVEFGASTILGTLFALMLYNPPHRKKRLLRFYDVLLDRHQ